MDHVITVEMVVKAMLIVVGAMGVIGVFILILNIFASGFDH